VGVAGVGREEVEEAHAGAPAGATADHRRVRDRRGLRLDIQQVTHLKCPWTDGQSSNGGGIMPGLGERSPTQTKQRLAMRAAFIERLRLSGDHELTKRIEHYVNRARSLRPLVLSDPRNLRKCYLLLAHILAATLLAYDVKGPHAQKFRRMCLREGVKVGPETPLLTIALKTFGAYDYSTSEKHRSADKKVSRDYQALAFALSQRKCPRDLVEFLLEHGLDACSRRLKPKSTKAKDWRVLARDQLLVRVQPTHRARVGSLKVGQRCVLITTATEEGLRLDLFGSNPANVRAIIEFAKSL
jgi:hypothetical protein